MHVSNINHYTNSTVYSIQATHILRNLRPGPWCASGGLSRLGRLLCLFLFSFAPSPCHPQASQERLLMDFGFWNFIFFWIWIFFLILECVILEFGILDHFQQNTKTQYVFQISFGNLEEKRNGEEIENQKWST